MRVTCMKLDWCMPSITEFYPLGGTEILHCFKTFINFCLNLKTFVLYVC